MAIRVYMALFGSKIPEMATEDIRKWTFADEVGYGFHGEVMSLRFILGILRFH